VTNGSRKNHSPKKTQNENTISSEYFNNTALTNRTKNKLNNKIKKGIKMFGNLLKKLTGTAKELASTALNASDKDVMEAMMAGAAIVAVADGEISDEEITTVSAMIKGSEQLAAFGDDASACFTKYCDKLQKTGRLGAVDVMKEITDVEFNSEDHKVRVLLIAIEVADADGNIDESEMKALNKIAKALGLTLNDYI
jgi:tellurite resistance protein TerB